MNKNSIFKKIILGFFIFFFILPIFARPVLAYQGTEGPGYLFEFEQAIQSGDMNLQSFVNETMKAIGGSIIHNITASFLGFLGGGGQPTGLLPESSIIMAGTLITPPISGIQYLKDLGKKIGIIKPAYAQESQNNTFALFDKIIPIWTAFRNLAYVLFVLILVGMGFAIMFRLKISPQAVITIQSALPRIVIGLLLITFSLAIAGLILNVIGFIQVLIVKLFIGNGGIFYSIPKFGELLKWVISISTKISGSKIFGGSNTAFVTSQAIILLFAGFGILIITLMLGPLGLLLGIIISILVFIAFIRVIWVALKAYAMIIISIIFAPLQLLMGALPGNTVTTDWFKNLVANAAVFPLITAMMMVASYLTIQGLAALFFDGSNIAAIAVNATTLGIGTILALPFVAAFKPLNIWDFFVSMLLPIIGVFIMLMTPKVSEIIQSFITKKPFQYGTAIGEAMGPVAGPIRGAYQTIRGGFEKKYQQDIAENVVPLVQNLPGRIFGGGKQTYTPKHAITEEEPLPLGKKTS